MADEWISSTWNQRLPGFCESLLATNHEIANTISSGFVVFWGIYGLYQLPSSATHQTSDIWQLIYSLLICVGIGSTLFHWTLYISYGLLDALPMLITEYIALYQVLQMILFMKLKCKFITLKIYNLITKCLNVIIIFICLLSIIFTSLYGQHHHGFVIMFGATPVIVLVLAIWSRFDPSLLKQHIKESKQYELIFRHLWIGFTIVTLSCVVWNVAEQLCDRYWILKYLPLHAFWHFVIGYGMYNLVQVGVFLDFNIQSDFEGDKKLQSDLMEIYVKTKNDGSSCFKRIWYHIVPVLYIKNLNISRVHSRSEHVIIPTDIPTEEVDPATPVTL